MSSNYDPSPGVTTVIGYAVAAIITLLIAGPILLTAMQLLAFIWPVMPILIVAFLWAGFTSRRYTVKTK